MNVETIASVYVNYIEPATKVVGFGLLIIFVIYIFNTLRDSKKKAEAMGKIIDMTMKSVVGSVMWTINATVWMVKMLLKVIIVIFATIRDFFMSKI